MRRSVFVRCAAIWFAVVLSGCGRDQGSLVVAKIEGRPEITVADLWRFQQNVPEYLKSEKTGVEAQREYLEDLIDRETMLLEARSRGVEEDPEVLAKIQRERRQKLVSEFQRREIRDKIEVTEEQMWTYFEENDLDREIRLSLILVKTEKEARAALEELAQGEFFSDVARARSIDKITSEHGGFTGRYSRQTDIRDPIREVAFSLEGGEVSDPIETSMGYVILKVTDERAVDFYDMQPIVRRNLGIQVYMEHQARLLEELAERYALKPRPEGLNTLRRAGSFSALGRLSEEDQSAIVFSLKGEEIRIADCLEELKAKMVRRVPALDDSAQVVRFMRQYVVSDVLMLRAALDAGIDREPEIAEWLGRNAEDAAIEHLRKTEVVDRVQVAEEEIRALYDGHTDWYMLPEQVTIREVLVGEEEEAKDLLERIRAGEDMEGLAERYTIRQGLREHKGKLRLREFEKALYGEKLSDAAMAAETDVLTGPVKVKDGYSVFKVLEKTGKRRQSYERAKRQARAYIQYEREQNLFAEYIRKLREQYLPQITVMEDNLQAAVEYAEKHQS